MNIEFILWDNDGVLVDTERLYFEANQAVLAPFGLNLTQSMFQEYWLKRSKGLTLVMEQVGLDLGSEEIEKMRIERNELYSKSLRDKQTIIDGARETLEKLNSRVRMGIVTSSRKNHFEIIHSKTGLMPYFEFVVANGDYARSKPAPDPYLKGLERAGVAKEKCLVIEDSERGLSAAKAAGLECWVIPFGISAGGDFSRADKVLGSIREVPELLEEL